MIRQWARSSITTDLPSVGDPFPRPSRPAPCGASLYRGWAHGAGHSLLEQAGQQALQRSANLERATPDQRPGLLATLPEPGRAQQSSTCSLPGVGIKRHQGPYGPRSRADLPRARALCQQVCETHSSSQLLRVYVGLSQPGALPTARGTGEQLTGWCTRGPRQPLA